MGLAELILIAIGLSMDAFAVAVCKGLSMQRIDRRYMLCIAAFFGGFQALMPLIGWFLGSYFSEYIYRYDHWIAFILLTIIGGNMLKEGIAGEEETDAECGHRLRELFVLAIATSIDAMAVGLTFAFLRTDILPAVALIGSITFLLSLVGVWVGNRFGARYRGRAECVGGVILILIGLKILLEHLGVL